MQEICNETLHSTALSKKFFVINDVMNSMKHHTSHKKLCNYFRNYLINITEPIINMLSLVDETIPHRVYFH